MLETDGNVFGGSNGHHLHSSHSDEKAPERTAPTLATSSNIQLAASSITPGLLSKSISAPDSVSTVRKNTELNEYSFGATFKYWDHFSHKKVYCVPKYGNLREEMLNNRVFTVSEFQWRDTLFKAVQIKMSYKGRSLFAINRGGTNNHYSIPYRMPISLSHIMVVLFYCNFDALQRKFKQQCRPTHKKESRQSLNERNSEIGHWFSLLKEVCWFYGQAMKPGDIFYHGINKTLLFTQFHARFRFPLSTTTSLKEASLFANFHSKNKQKSNGGHGGNGGNGVDMTKWNKVQFGGGGGSGPIMVSNGDEDSGSSSNEDIDLDDDYKQGADGRDEEEGNEGIIIELGYCELCFYIDVQMMSDFPAENEKLFFGADLAIQNIYYQNKSYKKFVSALTLFQAIINGRFFADILKENRVYQQILLNMIHNFQYKYSTKQKGVCAHRNGKTHRHQDSNTMVLMNGGNKTMDDIEYHADIPEYIQDLFEYFYLNQHYVWIIQSQLRHLDETLQKYFVPSCRGRGSSMPIKMAMAMDQEADSKSGDLHSSQKRFVLNLAGDYNVKQQHIKSYPLKYCVEYIWPIEGDEFERFKNMKNGEWINCEQEFRYEINQFEYEQLEDEDMDIVHGVDTLNLNGNTGGNGADELKQEENAEDGMDDAEPCFAVFQCSCAPSKTGKHSFFMKVNALSPNLERILFGVDLYCPSISFKTSVPRRWFRQHDYLGYTMFDSSKLRALQKSFEWHIAIKIYDYKKRSH